jgi:hypothetical protein
MGFTVQQQVDQRRQVLELLVREVGHFERRSRAVAGALVGRLTRPSALVVLLPELLGRRRCGHLQANHICTTKADGKSTTWKRRGSQWEFRSSKGCIFTA